MAKKVNEAKVAEVIRNDSSQASSAPTSVDVFTDVAALNWWMNSPIHRMNILMPQYTHIGVAYDNGNWVQLFASF